MPTIHQEIDELLTADLHDQLTEPERHALHSHLVDCAECRQLHKEYQAMNTALNETFETAKPEMGFEQRVLAAFRKRIPDKGPGVIRFLVLAMQSRTAHVAAVLAILLGLVQIGKFATNEKSPGAPDLFTRGPVIVTASNIPTAEESAPAEKFSESLAKPSMPSSQMHARNTDEFSSLAKGQSTDQLKDFAGGKGEGRTAGIGGETSHVTAGFQYYEVDPLYKRERALAKNAAPLQENIGVIDTGRGISSYYGELRAPIVGSETQGSFKSVAVTPSAATRSSAKEKSEIDSVAPAQPGAEVAASPRKLIRNAHTDLEVLSFQDTVEKITALAREAHGYLATSGSHKQENGKLRGEVVVKVLPDALDHFLEQLRGLGELKNQTIGTEDVSKNYFDTSARLDNARVMEQRLVEMLKKNTGKVSDLLQVEKELGRVREDIEKMQGELKFIDAQVQFATVTITIAEKDMNVPAAFLLEERARVGLFTADVEKTYDAVKALASAKVQITNAHLETANGGQVSGHINILIEPEQSEATITKIKELGRVQTFEVQTERVARGGQGMSESAKTEKDKVQVEVAITREEDEQSRQQTSLRIRSDAVDQNAQKLGEMAEREGAQVRHSSFNKDADGREIADFQLRLPMKNYAALMQSLNSLGKVEDVTVHREERAGQKSDEPTAPADISIQFYSRGNIVTQDSGLFATLRNTLAQGAGALMWSVRMIGVALAFLAPWVGALVLVIWIARRIRKARRSR